MSARFLTIVTPAGRPQKRPVCVPQSVGEVCSPRSPQGVIPCCSRAPARPFTAWLNIALFSPLVSPPAPPFWCATGAGGAPQSRFPPPAYHRSETVENSPGRYLRAVPVLCCAPMIGTRVVPIGTGTTGRAVPVTEPGGTVWLSVPQAARHLGISERAVRKRIAVHALSAQRDGRGPWRVRVGTGDEAVPEPPKVGTTEPGAERDPSALATVGDDWRLIVATKDQTIAAQAATIAAQAQTISALLAARVEVVSQEHTPGSSPPPAAPSGTITPTEALSTPVGVVARWWRRWRG